MGTLSYGGGERIPRAAKKSFPLRGKDGILCLHSVSLGFRGQNSTLRGVFMAPTVGVPKNCLIHSNVSNLHKVGEISRGRKMTPPAAQMASLLRGKTVFGVFAYSIDWFQGAKQHVCWGVLSSYLRWVYPKRVLFITR